MATLEEAARAEIEALPPEIRSGVLAEAVLDLARRLDEHPADTTAVLLVRELRMAWRELRAQAGQEVNRDLDTFLAGLSAEAFNAGH